MQYNKAVEAHPKVSPTYSHALQDVICWRIWEGIGFGREPYVFEIGAHDGWYNSNSRLFRESGCECVLGEADARHYASLDRLASSNITIIKSGLSYSCNGIDQYITKNKFPKTPDIIFLDIDGGEYQLLAGMNMRPSIICVEFERTLLADAHYIPNIFGYGHQASAISTLEIMNSKEYVLAEATLGDLIFVDEKVLTKRQKMDISKGKDYIIKNYWRIGLNPANSLFVQRYSDDPGNVFTMYKNTINKLVMNGKRDLAVDMMSVQLHGLMEFIYSTDGITLLNRRFEGMEDAWVKEWQEKAIEYCEYYFTMI